MDFAERAAHNEEIFRQINEVELQPDVYDEIASNPLHFIVKPEHQIRQIERVVADRGSYLVVEKVGEARNEIEREHPRRRQRPTFDA